MVDSTPLIDEALPSQGKMGHRVLCCCDSRKAVIILSTVAIVTNIAVLVLSAVPGSGVVIEGWWSIAISITSIVFYTFVIGGAIKYHRCAVTICLIWEMISLALVILAFAFTDWGSSAEDDEKYSTIGTFAWEIIIRVFAIYAFGTFLREVKSGIMSPETHGREKYSCCCNV
ncbi:hypothetical protein ACHAXA_010483 [Cyclostephanos tholiformis]|uniref:Uncharacterized protein n=1 Tax=Cyclostephanos tholiformis TaxID=382380 RepID=A0ABD3R404_9STRA